MQRKVKLMNGILTGVILVGAMRTFSVQAAIQNGWEEENGSKYWYENGVKQGTEGRGKEIYDPDSGAWYWLDAVDGGRKAVSKDVYQESNGGKWVRYDENGHMVKGWNEKDGCRYYFDPITGAMVKGEVVIDGAEYFFCEDTGILQDFASEIVRLVNIERRNAGLAEVSLSPNVQSAAQKRAEELVTYCSHNRLDGRYFDTILSEYNISWSYAGENIAAGSFQQQNHLQKGLCPAG